MKTEKLKFAEKNFWASKGLSDCPRFHWRDGIYFIRKGMDVRIIGVWFRPETNSEMAEFEPICEIDFTIPQSEWASIIAAVSRSGETTEKYYEAVNFHNK